MERHCCKHEGELRIIKGAIVLVTGVTIGFMAGWLVKGMVV